MPGGNTTQFIFAPDVAPNNRKYIAALAAGFFTFCLGCTAMSIATDLLVAGLTNPLTLLGSPIIFLGALLPNLLIAFAIPRLQRYQRSHRYVLIGAFLAGAIVAIPPALLFNTLLSIPAERTGADLLYIGTVPGIVEEGVKGAILLAIFFAFRDEFHDPVDGIVLGALVGLGFAMTEDITYFLRGAAEGGALGFIFTFVMRVFFGWMNHSVFTACTGAALGFARMGPPGPRRWLLGLGGYVFAAALHNSFNLSATLLGELGDYAILGIVPLYGAIWFVAAALGFVVLRGWHREADIVRDELRAEVDGRVVTPEEYFALPHPGRRRELLAQARRQGQEARRALGKRFQLQINLALQKRHTAYGDRPKVPELHSEAALRERLAALLPGAGQGGYGVPLPAPAAPGNLAAPAAGVPGAPPPPPAGLPPTPAGGGANGHGIAPRPAPAASERVGGGGDRSSAPGGTAGGSDAATGSRPAARLADVTPRMDTLRLVVTAGEQAGAAVTLAEGLTIGRGAARATFVLRDPEVSSLHARIERDPADGGLVLADAGSTNGAFVNGRRVARHRCAPATGCGWGRRSWRWRAEDGRRPPGPQFWGEQDLGIVPG